MARLNPGRLAAARALLSVEDGGHAEDLLAQLAPIEGPDRGLAWHLALGVLRRQGTLDAGLAPHLRQSVGGLDRPVLIALRIGLFEAALCRTPPHAAVDQAVELVRRLRAGRAAGLVNAVLRKATACPLPDDPFLDLPPWLQSRFAGCETWVERLRQPALVCGVWRDQPLDALSEHISGPGRAGGNNVPGSFVLRSSVGAVTELPGFSDGQWWVMDPASVCVADLAVGAADSEHPRILDACAAPGGKALRMASRGAEVTAVDISAERRERLTEAKGRTGLSFEVVGHDWLQGPNKDLGQFDVVLVDAPCTGLGTLRRHPEIRWRRLPSDPAAMAIRQRKIVRAAAEHVAPGGSLVYAVCSPMKEEGAEVLSDLAGWQIAHQWACAPPLDHEDGFQAFVLHSEAARTG